MNTFFSSLFKHIYFHLCPLKRLRSTGHYTAMNITKAQCVGSTYSAKVNDITSERPRSQLKEALADKRWYSLNIEKNNSCNRFKQIMYTEPLINDLSKDQKRKGEKRIGEMKQNVLTVLEVARTLAPVLKLMVGRK